MARNSIQLQKGLSLCELNASYGSEEKCAAAIFKWRWPDGFVCPACGSRDHAIVGARELYLCHDCLKQTSLKSALFLRALAARTSNGSRACDLLRSRRTRSRHWSRRASWCAARHGGIDAPQADVGDVRARGGAASSTVASRWTGCRARRREKRAGWRQNGAFGAQQDPFRRAVETKRR